MKLAILVLLVIGQLGLAPVGHAQLIAYESFAGIPVGSGLSGSGSNATGWTDAGWNNGGDARFQVVSPAPSLSYQLRGGPLIEGNDRALQLSTNPEPVPGNGVAVTRSIAAQNTTLFVSYLVRPVTIGTGSDAIGLRFYQGTQSRGGFFLRTDDAQSQQYFNFRWDFPLGGGSGGSQTNTPPLYVGQTYLIVLRIRFPYTDYMVVDLWMNPSAGFVNNPSSSASFSFFQAPSLMIDGVGFAISSADTGGPASSAIFDELRIGYTWADVVPQGPQPPEPPGPSKFRNISTRARVGTGDDALIAGFIAGGETTKRVIFRAIGPSLAPGLAGVLSNPTLSVYDRTGNLVAENDNWRVNQEQEIIDTGVAPTNDLESAVIVILQPGPYTAVVRGVGNSPGVAVVEAYDLN